MAFNLLNGDMGIIRKCCPRPTKGVVCKEGWIQSQGHINRFLGLSDSRIRKRLPITRCVDLECRMHSSHWIQFCEGPEGPIRAYDPIRNFRQ